MKIRTMHRLARAVALLSLLSAVVCVSGAQAPIRSLTNPIPPTVTAAMGDVGGKFFGHQPDSERTRRYYIAIEPELWDYAPQGQDPVCGKPLPSAVTSQRRGGKIRYVQYSDESFAAKLIQPPRLGILGPVLRGTVGDFLAVTLLNRTSQPLSMHPHGVRYDKDSEGSYYQPRPGLGAAVGPGAKFTYVWQLDEESGPLPHEPSSKGWLYHSHVNGDEEAALGLVGFIIVTDPKRARANGTPTDIDREEAALFMTFDESGLGAAEKEAAEYAGQPGAPPPKPWAQIQEMTHLGARRAINGYIFGNLPGLEVNEGERVRWYLFGLGSEEDFHTAHWHGLRVIEDGHRRTDNVELLPATMKVADMVADNPGSWLFHCHVAEHMMEGMFARLTVHPKESSGASRAPEQCFFGLRSAQQTLQIKRAEAVLDWKAGDAPSCELHVEGALTVFDAFSVFTQTVRLQIGATSVSFKPDRRGTATAPGGSWRVKNVSQFGVVYGGMMEFEADLKGADWAGELQKLGLTNGGPVPPSLSTSVTLQVGNARHTATAQIACRAK